MGQNVPVPGFINFDSNFRYSRLNGLNVPNSPTVKAENSNDISYYQHSPSGNIDLATNAIIAEDIMIGSPHSRHGTENEQISRNDTVFINSMDFNTQYQNQGFVFSQG